MKNIRDLVEKTAKELSAPAVGVVVIHDGEVLLNDAFGYSDIGHQVKATNKSVFRLASLTKHVTALAILRLVQEGKLTLNSYAKELLPMVGGIDSRITIEMLLNHTSGLVNYTDLSEFQGLFSLIDTSHEQMLDFFLKEPLMFKPGTAYAYCNSGYYLLGVIIEVLSEMTYGEYLDQEFFNPLGMTQTGYDDSKKIIPNRVRGYSSERGKTPEFGLINCEYGSMSAPFAAGGLCSSPNDMVKWCKAILAGNLVNKELLQKAYSPPTLKEGEPSQYGFGFLCIAPLGISVLAHDGGIMGFKSEIAIVPDRNTAIVVFANDECSEPSHVVRSFMKEFILVPERKNP